MARLGLLLPDGCRRPVTGGTIFGGGLVEKHRLGTDDPGQLVAALATHILMCSLKGELGPPVVIKERGFPLGAVVAVGAGRDPALGKLPAVDLFVAFLALRRRRPEIRVNQARFLVGRLVAIHAGCGPVRSHQREGSLRMIEARQLFPGLGGMAGLAAGRHAIGPGLQHTILELPLMRIGVATGAGEFAPVIFRSFGLKSIARLVAISARHRQVSVAQREPGLLVTRQRESGGSIALQVVTPVTAVEIWRGGELPRMLVGMAVGAALELDLEPRVLAFGDVTPRTWHHGVSTLQRIRRCGVVLRRECRGLETVHGVARSALAAAGSFGKLALVRVRLVAIHACLEGQRLLEISTRVALRTLHRGMLAQQRVFGSRVIEALTDLFCRHPLPSVGVVACLATLGKASAMRIGVTIRTLAESNSRVARFAVRCGGMTLLASDLCVQPGQRVAGLGMVELPHVDGFPVVVGVALKTILAQAPVVLVLVTGHTIRGNAQKGLIQVSNFDRGARGRRYVLGAMTAIAGDPRVFALEDVSRLLVVEGCDVPFDQRKIFSVMLGVATHASLAGARAKVVRGVQTLPAGNTRSNFAVAIHTSERCLPGGQFMAGGAVAGAIERLMCPRKGPRRNLRHCGMQKRD